MPSSVRSPKPKSAFGRRGEVLVPSVDDVRAALEALPRFEPIDTWALLPSGYRSMEPSKIDEAVTETYNGTCRNQLVQLLRALNCDPKNVWQDAVLKLARIHHNVGRLSHRITVGVKASTWTPHAEFILLMEMRRLTAMGLSERRALKQLAQDRSYRSIFPYREQRPGQRTAGALSVAARVAALRQKYFRLKKASKKAGWEQMLGISSNYEMFLTGLGIQHITRR